MTDFRLTNTLKEAVSHPPSAFQDPLITSFLTNLTGLIIGNGSTLQSFGYLANGELMIGADSTTPSKNTLSSDTNIYMTDGVGTIKLSTDIFGRVNSFSFVDSNGFRGQVVNSTTTPELTIFTSVDGLMQSDGVSLQSFGTIGKGQLLTGNSSNFPVPLNLIAGENITIVNNSGSIVISSSGGTLGDFTFINSNGFIGVVTNSTTTPNLTLSVATAGLLKSDGTSIQSFGIIPKGKLLIGNDTPTPVIGSLLGTGGIIVEEGIGSIKISSIATGDFGGFTFINANGFRGIVTDSSIAPQLSVLTGVTGLLKSNDGINLQSLGVIPKGNLLIGNNSLIPTIAGLTAGTAIIIANGSGSITIGSNNTGVFGGFSFVDTHGFRGTVTNPTSNPTLTLSTATAGLLWSDGVSLNSMGIFPNGSTLIGKNSTTPAIGFLTQGTGIIITNGTGSIKISSNFDWINAITNQSVIANRGYMTDVVNNLLTLTGSFVFGDTVKLTSYDGIWNTITNGYTIKYKDILLNSWATTNNSPSATWTGVASSYDGMKLVVVSSNSTVYTSIDGGNIWSKQNFPIGLNITGVASSADGNKLAIVANNIGFSKIYTSMDSGATWSNSNNSPVFQWAGIASSYDGFKLVAVENNFKRIYRSIDSGLTWSVSYTIPITDSFSGGISSSADGSKLVVATSGYIYVSTDSGSSWNPRGPSSNNWTGVASSSDGSKVVAVANNQKIYVSTNSGNGWSYNNNSPSTTWKSVTSSADGNRLVAVATNNKIYTSFDAGKTWSNNNNSVSSTWKSVTSSADGKKLVAVATNNKVYTNTLLSGDQGSYAELLFTSPTNAVLIDSSGINFQ